MTDIRFNGATVEIDATFTKSISTDYKLDHPGRRRSGGGERRALVHDFEDGLTVNWANDYPGGVTVNNLRTARGFNNGDWLDVASRIVKVTGTDLMLDSPGRRANRTAFRRAVVHGWNDTLTLNYNRDYPGGVLVQGRVQMPDGATIGGQDVAATISSLSSQITALTARVAALESGGGS